MYFVVAKLVVLIQIPKKLKSASGLLKRISSNIPKEYYKSLYYAVA